MPEHPDREAMRTRLAEPCGFVEARQIAHRALDALEAAEAENTRLRGLLAEIVAEIPSLGYDGRFAAALSQAGDETP